MKQKLDKQMNIEVIKYISNQVIDRQDILTAIHAAIIEQDNSITPVVKKMMGNEMIVYEGKGLMKYGLASMKNYMSLHVMPIYGSKTLFTKYQSLLDKARFQKGCINFKSADEMPINIVKQLFADCSKIDLVQIRERYLKDKNDPKRLKKLK